MPNVGLQVVLIFPLEPVMVVRAVVLLFAVVQVHLLIHLLIYMKQFL